MHARSHFGNPHVVPEGKASMHYDGQGTSRASNDASRQKVPNSHSAVRTGASYTANAWRRPCVRDGVIWRPNDTATDDGTTGSAAPGEVRFGVKRRNTLSEDMLSEIFRDSGRECRFR